MVEDPAQLACCRRHLVLFICKGEKTITTIYRVYKDGISFSRCDAKCHNAKHPDCKCICAGAHHGIGTKAAIEDRQNCTDAELIETAIVLFGDGKYRIGRTPNQMRLF